MFISKSKYRELEARIDQHLDLAHMNRDEALYYRDMVDSVLKLHKSIENNCAHCEVKYPCKTIRVINNARNKFIKEWRKREYATENA